MANWDMDDGIFERCVGGSLDLRATSGNIISPEFGNVRGQTFVLDGNTPSIFTTLGR
jgi:hypothetical protein